MNNQRINEVCDIINKETYYCFNSNVWKFKDTGEIVSYDEYCKRCEKIKKELEND